MNVVNPYRRIYSSGKENQVLNGKITKKKKKKTGLHKDQNNNKKQNHFTF